MYFSIPTAQAQPETISIQGQLVRSDLSPVTGVRIYRLRFFDAATNGNPIGSEVSGTVTVSPGGRFTIPLNPPVELAGQSTPYYELAIDSAETPDGIINPGDVFPERVKMHSVMYALDAQTLGGRTVNEFVQINDIVTTSGTYAQKTFWRLDGNIVPVDNFFMNQPFIGSLNPFPFEIRTSNTAAMKYFPSPDPKFGGNIVANPTINFFGQNPFGDLFGVTIAGGGGSDTIPGDFSYRPNRVFDHFGTISGGSGNTVGRDPSILRDQKSVPFFSHATVSGGQDNTASSWLTTIGGGRFNKATDYFATVSGGTNNEAKGSASYVGGGERNIANGGGAVVVGGFRNETHTSSSFIGGGLFNAIHPDARLSLIVGGAENVITTNSQYSVILGGEFNTASGSYALASGRRAKAMHNGAMVFTDSQDADFASTGNNQFLIRAAGGVGINTENPTEALTVEGKVLAKDGINITSGGITLIHHGNITLHPFDFNTVRDDGLVIESGNASDSSGIYMDPDKMVLYSPGDDGLLLVYDEDQLFGTPTPKLRLEGSGFLALNRMSAANPIEVGTDSFNGNGAHLTAGGIWTNGSDVNSKTAFEEIDNQAILDKILAMPVTRWRYKGESDDIHHIGPMAQDFKAAFGLGESERHIGTVDADGVSMAAIKALNERIEQKDQRISELEARLVRLEALLVEGGRHE